MKDYPGPCPTVRVLRPSWRLSSPDPSGSHPCVGLRWDLQSSPGEVQGSTHWSVRSGDLFKSRKEERRDLPLLRQDRHRRGLPRDPGPVPRVGGGDEEEVKHQRLDDREVHVEPQNVESAVSDREEELDDVSGD